MTLLWEVIKFMFLVIGIVAGVSLTLFLIEKATNGKIDFRSGS